METLTGNDESNNAKNESKYPDCFPPDFEKLIIDDGAGEYEYQYYRISRTGYVDRDAFIGTYEEQLHNGNLIQNRDIFLDDSDIIDIGEFSTSGYEKKKDAKKRFKLMKKHEDSPKLLVGNVVPSCGLSMRTKDSKTRECHNSHIDWWIYKDSHPEKYFKEVGED